MAIELLEQILQPLAGVREWAHVDEEPPNQPFAADPQTARAAEAGSLALLGDRYDHG